jgi:hypothetical protein
VQLPGGTAHPHDCRDGHDTYSHLFLHLMIPAKWRFQPSAMLACIYGSFNSSGADSDANRWESAGKIENENITSQIKLKEYMYTELEYVLREILVHLAIIHHFHPLKVCRLSDQLFVVAVHPQDHPQVLAQVLLPLRCTGDLKGGR